MNPSLKKSLVAAQIKVYERIKQALINFEQEININEKCNITPVVEEILCGHPEFFYVANQFKIAKTMFDKRLIPQYVYNKSQLNNIKRRIDDTVNEIISKCINDHQSEYDKALVLHDYLKTNVAYDYDACSVLNSTFNRTAISMVESHSMVGALLNKKCVCEGFAKAYKYLCERVGLECYVVSGEGNNQPHAWNIVKINGFYHHVDVTWDNQYAANDGNDTPNYSYFGLDDEEISKDHTWNGAHYPKCPVAPYNYFKINNAIVDCKSSLNSFFKEKVALEENPLMFKVVSKGPSNSLGLDVAACFSEFKNTSYGKSVGTARIFSLPKNQTYIIEVEYK